MRGCGCVHWRRSRTQNITGRVTGDILCPWQEALQGWAVLDLLGSESRNCLTQNQFGLGGDLNPILFHLPLSQEQEQQGRLESQKSLG